MATLRKTCGGKSHGLVRNSGCTGRRGGGLISNRGGEGDLRKTVTGEKYSEMRTNRYLVERESRKGRDNRDGSTTDARGEIGQVDVLGNSNNGADTAKKSLAHRQEEKRRQETSAKQEARGSATTTKGESHTPPFVQKASSHWWEGSGRTGEKKNRDRFREKNLGQGACIQRQVKQNPS